VRSWGGVCVSGAYFNQCASLWLPVFDLLMRVVLSVVVLPTPHMLGMNVTRRALQFYLTVDQLCGRQGGGQLLDN